MITTVTEILLTSLAPSFISCLSILTMNSQCVEDARDINNVLLIVVIYQMEFQYRGHMIRLLIFKPMQRLLVCGKRLINYGHKLLNGENEN